ncbi:NADH-quinone oxidoreductase subunit H, partial [Candidatus Sumerlaeota bacterium]|nr:NADH-quinone oxidoreductase subunit H [Candidatus Sumerlaeota bacterium]
MDWIDYIAIPLVKVAVVGVIMIACVPFMVLFERKLIGYIQQRPGPNRVGPWGVLQTIVDGIKLLLKEDLIPPKAERAIFIIAPILALVPAMVTMTIVPFGPPLDIEIAGKVRTISLGISDLPVGILLYFAMTSVGVYGVVLAGWSSNSKYSLLGGIRSTAQLLSYELTLGLSLIGVLLITGSFEMRTILASQESWGILGWHIWRQPVGFLLFLLAGFAETNRLPFDLPEGETELGAGFHTEYSSLKWATFMMAEYMNILTFGAIMTTLFLGGYHGPIHVEGLSPVLAALSGLFWFSIK